MREVAGRRLEARSLSLIDRRLCQFFTLPSPLQFASCSTCSP